MSASVDPSLEMTRTALGMCAASDRHDAAGWMSLVSTADPYLLISAFSGICRGLVDKLAESAGMPPADVYRRLLDDLVAHEAGSS